METKKIDITSTVLEKGLETAKSFLDKLIMPAVEETGLLLKDQVTMWKFRNQVKMLNKAKAVCEKNNISPKTISLKLLCPLLDYSGIEEDEVLHDKWAILLSNMVDSEQNVENHVFPYILSQLSSNEFLVLEKVYNEKVSRATQATIELEKLEKSLPSTNRSIDEEIFDLKAKIKIIESETHIEKGVEIWILRKSINTLAGQKTKLTLQIINLNNIIKRAAKIPVESFKKYELSNAIRLGIVKEEKEFYTTSQTLEIPNSREDYGHTNVDLDINVESNTDNLLTELGELFLNACKDKQHKK